MIYLDHAATTPCAQEVVDAMTPLFREQFANASSIDHIPGSQARRLVEDAREVIAALVDARAEDVIFTSGSTEANNLALSVDTPVLTSPVEHPSISDTFAARKCEGDRLLAIDATGTVVLSSLKNDLLRNPNVLVSIIATNNETGTEQNVESLASIIYKAGAMLHVDATQAVGSRALTLRHTNGLVGISMSAHKMCGPKGIGALVASSILRRRLSPTLRGGGHERGLRSGTLNVPAIVGFGVAAKLVMKRRDESRRHFAVLRRTFLTKLAEKFPGQIIETVSETIADPHILSIRLIGVNGRALLRAVRDDIAFSLGSACATNKTEPSPVLLALGLDKHAVAQTIRISFGREQDESEVLRAGIILADAATKLSSYSLTA